MGWFNIFSLFGVMLILVVFFSLSVLIVLSKSVSGGFIYGLFVVFGVVLGDIIFIFIVFWGLVFLWGVMGDFFVIFKYISGIYLSWLGINII